MKTTYNNDAKGVCFIKWSFIFFPVCFLIAVILTGCGSSSSGGEGGGLDNNDSIFYTAAQEVAPTFEQSAGSGSLSRVSATRDWTDGSPLYEVFYIFQDFNPSTDQGVIDTSNIYKTLWEGRNFLTGTRADCTAITEQAIAPPFDFGNEPSTYNCVVNDESEDGTDFAGAIRELDAAGNTVAITDESRQDDSAPVKYGVFGFVWQDDGDNHFEYGALEGFFNSTTNDLSLDIAVWVDYETEPDYCYRNDVSGNAATHEFTLRSIKGNPLEGAAYTSIVGKGYSQGEGNYFLLKINSSALDGSKYYCIGAEDGEAELSAMDESGSDTVDANCAEFEAAVDALTAFTTDDLACATDDFNPGGEGDTAEGTVFISYQ